MASWAGLRPDNHESAGKPRSGRIALAIAGSAPPALIEAALTASVRSTTVRLRDTLSPGPAPGHKKAVVAVAHAILVTAYHLLARQIPYEDPLPTTYDRRHAERVRHQAIPNGGPPRLSPSNPAA